MKDLKISIVTPNLNQGDYLEETILSVLNQNYPNLEYIIIDGGSKDKSLSILEKYSAKLSYWVSEKDSGLYDALNKGFAKSSGEIMLYINSDDILLPNSLHSIATVFTEFPEIKWITGINTKIDEKSRIIETYHSRKISKFDFLMSDYKWVQQESTCWRRNLWDETGGSMKSNLKFAGDLELWTRFINKTNLVLLRTPIGAFRIRKGQLSEINMSFYEKEASDIIKEFKHNASFKEKIIIALAKFIKLLSIILKFTLLLDLHIFRKLIKYGTNRLKNHQVSIYIDPSSLKFKKTID